MPALDKQTITADQSKEIDLLKTKALKVNKEVQKSKQILNALQADNAEITWNTADFHLLAEKNHSLRCDMHSLAKIQRSCVNKPPCSDTQQIKQQNAVYERHANKQYHTAVHSHAL